MADTLLKYVVNNGSVVRTVPLLSKDGKPKLDGNGNLVESVKRFGPGEVIEMTAEEAAQYDEHFVLPQATYAKKQQLEKLQAELAPQSDSAEA